MDIDRKKMQKLRLKMFKSLADKKLSGEILEDENQLLAELTECINNSTCTLCKVDHFYQCKLRNTSKEFQESLINIINSDSPLDN